MTRKTLVGLVSFGLALSMSSQASAGWGSWGSQWSGGTYGSQGSWGSRASYGSTGSVVYASGGSYGSYGSFGSGGSRRSGLFHGGLISRIRGHHARRRGGGSWGGSYGGGSHGVSYGSWGGSYSSYGSAGGHGSAGGYGSAPVYSDTLPGTPVYDGEVTTERPSPPPPPAPDDFDDFDDYDGFQDGESEPGDLDPPDVDDSVRDDATRGLLLVSLPEDAKLRVNGHTTSSVGETRRFVSTGLQPGYRYPYTVEAVMDRDGQTVVETKQVELRAGRSVRLAFDVDQPVETMLTVELPADADLTLAGSRTVSKGAQRKFTTSQLSEGQIWSAYTIVASLERDGQTIKQERTIDLRAGESRHVSFDFDLNQVASR